ncbi:MAG: hypothetical protein IJG25_03950 [Thermoguttaceae bacterium]|nr:hypothetical protein [Thermoguttaceae bacterium]
MRNKIISLILLAAFGLPGICSEGLHRLLPFGIGMIHHQNALGDSGQAPSVPSNTPIKFNQNCPICHFCAQLMIVTALFVFFLLLQRPTKFVETASKRPFLPFDRAHYLRGPPAAAC